MTLPDGPRTCAAVTALSAPCALAALAFGAGGVAANVMGGGLALGFGYWLADVMRTSPEVPQ